MRPFLLLLLVLLLLPRLSLAAEPEFPLTEDSKPMPGVSKGDLIKGSHTATEGSVFPGTVRDYTLYLPPGFDKTKPAPFMVFQDGVIYQAPTVFDNLIARKEIPPLVGIFVKPGVVPAANENALPRFNRSYEYDSITDTYASFLIDEFLPAIEKTHGITLSTDPNDASISGNSSGGIAAFMVAWHRHDRFRRVFTGVGTYVGIRGGDQLPVLVRKFEPKPLKIFLQSGTGDNNLYCGDWWMANQMMERSLTWAGYDVNHAWGEGGHNQKHASQIFPDVLRWLWKGWPENKEVKTNPRGESKWRGYEVCSKDEPWEPLEAKCTNAVSLAPNLKGDVYFFDTTTQTISRILTGTSASEVFKKVSLEIIFGPMAFGRDGRLYGQLPSVLHGFGENDVRRIVFEDAGWGGRAICIAYNNTAYVDGPAWFDMNEPAEVIKPGYADDLRFEPLDTLWSPSQLCLSPDQSLLHACSSNDDRIFSWRIDKNGLSHGQSFFKLESPPQGNNFPSGLCVDTDGRLYVGTTLGIQVCDQAGRVNFIIPTPQQPMDICFGGKDLSELFITCRDKIYKRPTKVRGIVSGQMTPIKPAPPKL